MLRELTGFLEKNWDGRAPLLLGYSGGPDSKALLYALLESGCRNALHIAHVDHGWRNESGAEAHALAREAEGHRIPFHTVRVSARGEAASRDARLAFFRSLFRQIPFQALLLAHHAGDAAETALKRILEGANLPNLAGMDPVSSLQGMILWRPLLSICRAEIEAFLKEKDLKALIDPTNLDPAYLRARMRIEILPLLAKIFGKEISENLLLHAGRSRELKNYLDERVENRIPARGPWGLYGAIDDLKRIEARHLLQKWARQEDASMPRSQIEQILDAAASKLPNRKITPRIFVDRGTVFILARAFPRCGEEPLSLSEGVWEWGDWKIEVEELMNTQVRELQNSLRGGHSMIAKPIRFFANRHNLLGLRRFAKNRIGEASADLRPNGVLQFPQVFKSDWKDVWTGSFMAFAPPGRLVAPIVGNSPRDLWNERRVPAFLRYKVPVAEASNGLIKEFLSGKILPEMRFSFKLAFSTCSGPTL